MSEASLTKRQENHAQADKNRSRAEEACRGIASDAAGASPADRVAAAKVLRKLANDRLGDYRG